MKQNTILIAEDDENDIVLMQHLFKTCKVLNPIQVVSDGEEAIAYLSGEGAFADRSRHPVPALFLLDLKMIKKGGLEVLEWLQTQPRPAYPVIILTGMQDLSQMKEAYKLGAHSFLMKPLEKNEFLKLVSSFDRIQTEQTA
ncbi:MAG: response regulator receiver protein [Pedosphaera sp.]|nr:response regulator receiver protein [Pedosphaera sp.]